jgi:S-DNA-T family DNA segregation ATPase FtsK/SpoIIIE
MIDPKQVELSIYEGLPHLYRPIVKGAPEAITALAGLCGEMDNRYRYISKCGAKSVSDTNLPRIYCVIDELADLMLTSKNTVENYIIRIAQRGRAAGIHLIIATQRPTVNIITGLIKANIPTKIALAVSNVSDSVTILNHGGAEKLTGRGDAIIKTPDSITEKRFQALFTPDTDIQAIVSYYNPPRRRWFKR